MTDDTMWTPPRSLTFFERMRVTYALFLMRLPLPLAWLMVVWSSGATVSISPTDRLPVKLHIASGNGHKEVTVTITK